MQETIKLSKYIAHSGICSRRQAEQLILSNKVSVNNVITNNVAIRVSEDDKIKVNNRLLNLDTEKVIYKFYKPKGFLVSNRDDKNRKTIFDIIPKKYGRLISIGRLDYNTEGLLLLTNNGDLARYIEHPKTSWTRKYRVRVNGTIDKDKIEKAQKGLRYKDASYLPCKIIIEKEAVNSWLNISITEGKNREVRNILEYCGLTVSRLIRTSFGSFNLGNMKPTSIEKVNNKTIKELLGNWQKVK